MKKRLFLLLLVFAIMISGIGCSNKTDKAQNEEKIQNTEEDNTKDTSSAQLSERKVLRVGTPGQHYPWNFFEGGELKGADVETLEEACRRIGYDVEFEIIAFEGLYGSIDAGTTDTGA